MKIEYNTTFFYKYSLSILLGFAVCCLTFSCNKQQENCRAEPDGYASAPIKLDVVRLESSFFKANTKADLSALFDKYPLFSNKFLERNQLPADSILINEMWALRQDKYIDTMQLNVAKIFSTDMPQIVELKDLVQHVKYYFSDFSIPQVVTMVTGFSTDVYATDSLIVIGLESFTGPKGYYKPPNMPAYISKRFNPSTLTSHVSLMLSNKYNKSNIIDNTLLKDMIVWGKAYYFMEKTMPCLPDSNVIGFSARQISEVKEHERDIWKVFISQKLLFNTDAATINRFVGERPITQEIGPKCPGRIGRYIGWQIVKAYAAKTGLPLKDIMAEKDAQKIFRDAAYKP